MNLSIRRQGIVLKTVTVNGDRARIGSGEDCEIQLNDPYLAAHVADLIQKDNQWRIVDAGTSLEGVSRDGARIEDEVLAFGQPYVVGGFEIVPEAATVKASAVSLEAAGAGRRPAPPPGAPRGVDPQAIPKTMFGGTAVPKTMMAGEVDVPKTMFGGTAIPKTMMTGQVDVPKTEMADLNEIKRQISDSQQNRPAAGAALAGQPVTATKAPSKKRMLLLGCAAILFVVLVTLVMIIAFSKPQALTTKPGTATAVTSTSTTTAATATTMSSATTTSTATATTATTTANPVGAEVNYDKTLAVWEATLDKSPTPELRARYVRTAFEVGMVYSAAHRTAEAAAYFQKIVKYGEPGTKEVLAAKSKLGMQ